MKYKIIFIIVLIYSIGYSQSDTSQIKKVETESIKSIGEVANIILLNPNKEKSEKSKENLNVWKELPNYIPLIQSAFWFLLLLILYLIFRKPIREIGNSVKERINKGASFETGLLKVGELIESTEQFAQLEQNEKIFGNPDHFKLLFKVQTETLKKSTKAMQLDEGCILQVTTEKMNRDGNWVISEALTYVPKAKVVDDDPETYAEDRKDKIGSHIK